MRMMNKKALIFLVVLFGIVIVVLASLLFFLPSKNRSSEPEPVITSSDWITYRSEKYGFEIKHPADWIVQAAEGVEPKINIYKKTEAAKPPFIHHDNVTQVSIFPKGIGTEGVDGEAVTSTVKFSEPVSQSLDFVLDGRVPWAAYATFAKSPASWQPYGFVWAGVRVDNLSIECVLNGVVLPSSQCDLGDRPPGAKMVWKGNINQADRAVEERILGTLLFWDMTVKGEIVCLPHKDGEPQTEECAIGLRGDDGKHYGLIGLDQEDIVSGKWTSGVRVVVSGELASVEESAYDIIGNISIRDIAPDAP